MWGRFVTWVFVTSSARRIFCTRLKCLNCSRHPSASSLGMAAVCLAFAFMCMHVCINCFTVSNCSILSDTKSTQWTDPRLELKNKPTAVSGCIQYQDLYLYLYFRKLSMTVTTDRSILTLEQSLNKRFGTRLTLVYHCDSVDCH